MRTTTDRRVAVAAIAADATQLLLSPRKTRLRKRAPRDPRIHLTRRLIACGKATPFQMLLLQSLTDLADGIPVAEVVAPYEHVIAAIVEESRHRGETPRGGLLALIRAETRAQSLFDEAQLAAAAEPDNVVMLEAMLAASAHYDGAQERLIDATREKLATLKARSA